MEGRSPNFYVSSLLLLVAIIGFALTAFGVTLGDSTAVEMLAGSSAFFAAAHLVP